MTFHSTSALRSSVAIPAVAFLPSGVVPFPARNPAVAPAPEPMVIISEPAEPARPFVPPVSNFDTIRQLRDAAAEAEAERVKTPPAPVIPGIGSAVIERAGLLAALAAVAKVVEKRNTIPVLANVRLSGTPDGLRIVGTDLDIEAAYTVAGAADAGLDVTVPCHTMLDLVKKAKATEHVGIVYDGATVAMDFEGLKISLSSFIVASDFPALKADLTHSFTMPTAALAKALAKTAPAISTEETRYYLNGICLQASAYTRLGEPRSELRFTATDGHRLVHYAVPGPDDLAFPSDPNNRGFIVPRKTVAEMLRHAKAKGAPDSVTIQLSEERIRFTLGGLVLTSKLIDGTFPDYERVIPRNNGKRLRLDVKQFDSAIQQVMVIASDRGRAVKLDISADALRLVVSSPDTGTAQVKIPADYESEPMEIGFNSSYVRDMLALVDAETVVLALADPGSPTLFSDPDDAAFTGVLMPMRV